MKTIYVFTLFILLALIQIVVPAQMIWQQEDVLKNGIAFKFKTEPIDPSNPFKGKFIRLKFEADAVLSSDSTWQRNENIYVSIERDSLGFAQVSAVSRAKPMSGYFTKAKINWYNKRDGVVRFSFPFTEFYMNENKAYNAEIAHRKAQRHSSIHTTYAMVYIKDGNAVLENVYINDIPIARYVEN